MDGISIVIPVYNAERYLKPCIKSIQKQTYKNWKLICVNDGSTDNSLKILKHFEEKDPRIYVLDQKNQGSATARKNGVLTEIAQNNRYLIFCDADDILSPRALDILYTETKKNDADLVCGNTKKMIKGISVPGGFQSPCFKIKEAEIYQREDIMNRLLISYYGISNYPVSLCAKLFKTDIITEAIQTKSTVCFLGEDLWVSLQTMIASDKVVIIPDTVYLYRMGGGTSKFMDYYLDDFIKLYNYKHAVAENLSIPQDWERFMNIELMNITKCHIQQCIRLGKFDEDQLEKEVVAMCERPEVLNAAKMLIMNETKNHQYEKWILEGNINKIISINKEIVKKGRLKESLKRWIMKL